MEQANLDILGEASLSWDFNILKEELSNFISILKVMEAVKGAFAS